MCVPFCVDVAWNLKFTSCSGESESMVYALRRKVSAGNSIPLYIVVYDSILVALAWLFKNERREKKGTVKMKQLKCIRTNLGSFCGMWECLDATQTLKHSHKCQKQ